MGSGTRGSGDGSVKLRLPIEHENPAETRLLAICAALASEVAALRERLDTHERLAAAHGVFTPDDVDGYEPDPVAIAVRDRVRQGQIARIFRPLLEDAEREAGRARAAQPPD